MKDGKLRIAFDIGGVLSKYPEYFRALTTALVASPLIELFVITDMNDRAQTLRWLADNGFDSIPQENVLNADYHEYGELCKAVALEEHAIDIHIDDHMGYLTEGCPIRLFLMPSPELPYYHETWETSGSEGDFGRRGGRRAATVKASE